MKTKLSEREIGYREGYGQCKADMMIFVKEAMEHVRRALNDPDLCSQPVEKLAELRFRWEELKRVRCMLKAVRSKR